MQDQLCRITLRDANVNGLLAETLVVVGYPIKIEPEKLAKWELQCPSDPDTEIEVGYSKDRRKPLYLVYKDREVKLTETNFRLFVHIYDLYRMEGQTEFEFASLSEELTGDECKIGRRAIESSIRRIAIALSKILAPISLIYKREIVYVRHQICR